MKILTRFFLSDRNMMIAILLSAITICLLYFPELESHHFILLLDHLFIYFFLVEAIVKLSVLKPKAYFENGWNRFDFFIVLVSLPSLLTYIFPFPDTSLFILLRLFRLARLVRFIHFVPNLSKIITGLGRAIKSSVFVLLALVFFNFLLSIFSCHFYAKIVPEYFGNPLIASYSIFQMFTVEGWNEIPATIAEKIKLREFQYLAEEENISMAQIDMLKDTGSYAEAERVSSIYAGLTRFYFVLVVLIGGIFGMSLANAVFVDEMTMDNNDVLENKISELHKEIQELKNLLQQKNE